MRRGCPSAGALSYTLFLRCFLSVFRLYFCVVSLVFRRLVKRMDVIIPSIKVKLEGGVMPLKSDALAAAFDLYVPADVELHVGRQVVDMGFRIELPHGYAATIQPRSGFSAKGIEAEICGDDGWKRTCRIDADVIRGLVDENYRGRVGVILKVSGVNPFAERVVLKKGTRIAQMQIVQVPSVVLEAVDELDMSNDRGGGFGHTGV